MNFYLASFVDGLCIGAIWGCGLSKWCLFSNGEILVGQENLSAETLMNKEL